jgi:glycosyltransferase involved in cell wall biosynthesis
VPAFNSERYLAEALDSILKQTYRPIEVIVADDGSADGTPKLVASYGDTLRCVTQVTAGPAATRNLGLHAATGSFVAFLDADDLWHPEKLARQFARFQAKPALEYCVTHVQMFWADEIAGEAEHYKDHPRAHPLPGYATTTLLARRRTFDRVGDFDTTLWFGDATDWFMRAAEQNLAMELLPDVLTYHRMHTANLTRRHSEESKAEFLRIVKASLDRRRIQSPTKNG